MSSYWADRFLSEEERRDKDNRRYYSTIEKEYNKALAGLEKDIEYWLGRIAKNNDISLSGAKELLSKKELQEFKWTVEEYIKKGEENGVSGQWLKQLENASARVHIQRLEALKIQIQDRIENMYTTRDRSMEDYLCRVYKDTYYHTVFEIDKGIGNIQSSFNKLDDRKVSQIIHKPWATDGKDFSTRIWEDKANLVNTLHTGLTQSLIRGGNLDDVVNDISQFVSSKIKNKKYVASRLVTTESAAYASKAQEQAYKDLSVDKYEILATLDLHTSDICQDLDGKIFDRKDYQVGVTAPPFHPNCRTVTVPWFPDDVDTGERAARGKDGKVGYIPQNMTYKEWYNKYVEQKFEEDGIIELEEINIKLGELEKDLGEIHSKEIKRILSKAPKNIQKIWNRYADEFKFANTKHKGTANYSTYKNAVSLNLEKVMRDNKYDFGEGRGPEISEKAYGTFFHEFGHNISALISRDKGVKYYDYSDIFESKKYINKKGSGYMLSEMLKEEADEKIKALAKEKGIKKSEAYWVMSSNLRKMTALESGDISDIFSGCTKNRSVGYFKHDTGYWRYTNVGVEAFAEMFDATINNPDSLKRIKEYFPKSYDIFLEMLDSVEVD